MKGDIAKKFITDAIIQAFPEGTAFVQDRKIYIEAEDGTNGKVQIAISLTMPKTPIGAPRVNPNDWTGESNTTQSSPAEITPEDAKKVEELMQLLGIKDD